MVAVKPHIIIQARMGSTRLPEKVMREIGGIPMIGLQLERLKKTNLPLIVASSCAKKNDLLVEYLESIGIDVYRGSEDNVLDRFYQAAKHYGAKDIIRITGDNPLIDPYFIIGQLDKIKVEQPRYYLSEGENKKLPLGMAFEMFPYSILEEAHKNASSENEREHVTPYMHQNFPGNISSYVFENLKDNSSFRLTVDTESDFVLIKELIVKYNCKDKTLEEIINILDKNPYLKEINQGVYQKKWNE